MKKEILKDKYGKKLGEIIKRSDGVLQLKDRYGKYLGKYDPKRNETKDKHGKLIGKGNLLVMLLEE